MTDDHHDHHAADHDQVAVAVLTVSSSRTLQRDPGGDAVVAAVADGGHDVTARELVGDDRQAIRDQVEAFVGRPEIDAVVSTGGTGVTPDDVTVEAVRPLFDRELPGFGEQFRARSVESVGPRGMLSRATAGVCGAVPIFCLPGSEDAARMGTAELVVPVLGHVVGLAAGGAVGGDHRGHEHGDDAHGDDANGGDHE